MRFLRDVYEISLLVSISALTLEIFWQQKSLTDSVLRGELAMKCEIITVGTEILMGQITNTNARDMARQLQQLGIGVYYHTVVGDNGQRLKEVFMRALERTDLVLLTGGLGPTQDDLTRETVAEVMGLPLEKNRRWEERLEEFFRERGRTMSVTNRKQAKVPRGGVLLPNERGTAPGIYLEKEDKTVIMLPGPPKELNYLFQEQVSPRLKEKLEKSGELAILKSKVLRVIGLGESTMAEKISPVLEKQTNPTIAPLAKMSEVHLRITARASNSREADELISQTKREIKEILGDYIYGEDEEELEQVVAKMLWDHKKTLALAESCSGGLLCNRLTNIPGSSSFLWSGLVTYSNSAKSALLGVDESILEEKGAVSPEVAYMMANGARNKAGSDIGISITGIAGPGGETPEKPVGLTYLALVAPDKNFCRKYQWWGDRKEIKERAAQSALQVLRLYLMGKLD